MDNTNKKTQTIITCNACNQEIDDLYYNVRITETEVGTATIKSGPIDLNGSIRHMIEDHESSETYDGDWNDTPNYECPHCNAVIDSMDDLTIKQVEIEEPEKKSKLLTEEFEELNFQIISPKEKKIFTNEIPKSIKNNTIICSNCNKIIQDTEESPYYSDMTHEGFIECNCGNVINMKQYYDEFKQT